jgi:hypothetical protein
MKFTDYCPPLTKEEKSSMKKINRRMYKLANDGSELRWYQLKKSTSWGEFTNLGRLYVIDVENNMIAETHIDLEQEKQFMFYVDPSYPPIK